MADKFEYSRQFRLKILALMLDKWSMSYGSTLVKPEYFEMEDEEAVARAILQYREAYNKFPSDPEDIVMLAGTAYSELIYDIYDIHAEKDLDLVKEIVVQFAKEQAAKIAVLQGVDDIKKGDLKALVTRVQDATKVGENLLTKGIDPYRDVDKWLTDYWSDKVTSGLMHCDWIMEGGLGKGELGVMLAPLNRGKSMSLVNVGYCAASLYGGGKNVVHFVHEMSAEQTAKRYAARTLFRFPTKEDNPEVYGEELWEVARKLVKGKIRIIHLISPQLSEIKAHLDSLADEGFRVDLIIDDYPDLITPSRHYSDRRFELSSIFGELRNLASEYGVPCWAATQGNRDSLSKDIITAADIAEDIGKANIADVIISICQSYDEEQLNQCRLFMAKVRDGKAHQLVGAKFFGSAQAIVTTNYMQMKKTRGESKDV